MQILIKLDKLLEKRGITERSLARLTEIRHTSINEMCRNQTKRMPLENLAKICEILQCEITDILELVPDTNKKAPTSN